MKRIVKKLSTRLRNEKITCKELQLNTIREGFACDACCKGMMQWQGDDAMAAIREAFACEACCNGMMQWQGEDAMAAILKPLPVRPVAME